jgi:hypothetical protein
MADGLFAARPGQQAPNRKGMAQIVKPGGGSLGPAQVATQLQKAVPNG